MKTKVAKEIQVDIRPLWHPMMNDLRFRNGQICTGPGNVIKEICHLMMSRDLTRNELSKSQRKCDCGDHKSSQSRIHQRM